MKVFVTGGGGFLGKAIVTQLHARGDEVISYSRQPHPALKALGIEHRQGDLTELGRLSAAMRDCHAVIHVAAKAGVWGSYHDFHQTNVVGTENILKACARSDIDRLVYTSSPSVVHGGESIEGANESLPYPEHFEGFYPQTKAIAERMVLQSNRLELATVALRPHIIWGPEDPHFVPRILGRAKAGRLRLIGDGSNRIDTVYVDNAATAHLQALDRLEPGAAISGKAYFITQGEPLPVGEFVNRMLAAAHLPPLTRSVPPGVAFMAGAALEQVHKLFRLPGEPLLTRFTARQLATSHWFDITAARQELGYDPQISLDEGFRRLEAWLQKHPNVA